MAGRAYNPKPLTPHSLDRLELQYIESLQQKLLLDPFSKLEVC